MYNANASTSSRQENPRSPQTIQEEVPELNALSTHRLESRYTNDNTVDESVHFNHLSLSEHFQSEQNRRPVPGLNRNILHAAAIFDPSYQPPPPLTYQLPPRGPGYYTDFLPNAYTAWESHQRNDSGYESAPYAMMEDDEEEDGIDAWCDAVLSQGAQLESNQHVLRPEAPCFEPKADSNPETQEDVYTDARSNVSTSISDDPDFSPSSIRNPKHPDRNFGDRFKVTAYEREVLDYEGLRSSSKYGWRDTQSDNADPPHGDTTRDTESETACPVSGYTWKLFQGSAPKAEPGKEKGVDRRFKVTDFEPKVLDYEGYTSKFRQNVKDTQSGNADHPPVVARDTQSDSDCSPFGKFRDLFKLDCSGDRDVKVQQVDDGFKVTDYEREVLDYEGFRSKIGRGVRDTQSERAETEDDEDFDGDRPIVRYQWSFSL